MPQLIIAEDDPELLQLYASFGQRAGWTVQTCLSGADLHDVLSAGREPVLLLIDINMPVKDGIEAIEDIVLVQRPLRIRFMTGGEDAPMLAAKLIATARDLPVGRSIYKPLSREVFLAMLEEEAALLAQIDPKEA
jgi:CheY-like chemotaxis protein